jgi:hypothetical protein
MQFVEDAGLVPVAQVSPAGHSRTAAELRGQVFPRDAGSHHEEDAGEDRALIGRRPAATPEAAASPARVLVRGQQRLDDPPQLVRYQRLWHRALLGNELPEFLVSKRLA